MNLAKLVSSLALAALTATPVVAAPLELQAPRQGISLLDGQIESLYTVLPIGQDQVVAFGKNRFGEAALVLGDAPASFTVLVRFDDEVSSLVRSPGDVTLGILPAEGGERVRLILLYQLDDVARRFDKSRTMLELITLDGSRLIDRSKAELVAGNSIETEAEEPDGEWLLNSAKDEGPATTSETRVFVEDVNHDGFQDVVVWTKQCRSQSRKSAAAASGGGECPEGFEIDRWSAKTMLFDPKVKSFGPLAESEELTKPSKELWDRGLGSVLFPNFSQP